MIGILNAVIIFIAYLQHHKRKHTWSFVTVPRWNKFLFCTRESETGKLEAISVESSFFLLLSFSILNLKISCLTRPIKVNANSLPYHSTAAMAMVMVKDYFNGKYPFQYIFVVLPVCIQRTEEWTLCYDCIITVF